MTSAPGQGSTFHVALPGRADSSAVEPAPAAPPPPWRGAGKILVVDDEETMRFLARRILQDAGFVVVGGALHYPLPLHLQKCYASLGHKAGAFPVSEKAASECLSLPIYPELTDQQVQRVADVIKDFFKK